MAADTESNTPPVRKKETAHEVKSTVYYVPYDKLDILQGAKSKEYLDVYDTLRRVWSGKYKLAISVSIFLLIGLFVAFFSAKQYTSNCLLIPEVGSATESRAEQLLRRYGSGLGIGSVTQVPEGVIPPMLFPQIVHSTPFQQDLVDVEISFQTLGKKMSYREYMVNYHTTSPVDLVKGYTIGLPGKIISFLIRIFQPATDTSVEPSELQNERVLEGPIRLTFQEQLLIEGLRARISVEQDLENGLINARVNMPDPLAAAELNYAVVELLKKYITDYQLQKIREDLEFTRRMKEESEERFTEAQTVLADFLDSNKVLSTSRAKIELERLQDEKNLAFGIYNSVSQRLEQTKLQLNEQRPTFKEVQPVTVPLKETSPQKMRIIAVSTLFGIISGLFWIFVGNTIVRYLKQS